MHQAFTGRGPKQRQVNLSGRSTANPWAALSKPGSGQSSTASNPLAQAQAERLKRNQERDRLNATKRIQRIWRGHSSRRHQKASWRRMWDENERLRLGTSEGVDYQALIDADAAIPAYENVAQLLLQIRLLIQYQEYRRAQVREEQDTFRLIYFGQALQSTLVSLQSSLEEDIWKKTLSRLGLVAARHLKSILSYPSNSTIIPYRPSLMKMIAMLTIYAPDEMATDSLIYFHPIKMALRLQKGEDWQKGCLETIWAFLRYPSRKQDSYSAFLTEIMTEADFANDSAVLARLATPLDIVELSLAIKSELNEGVRPHSTDQRLWQLAYLIYFHDAMQRGSAGRAYIEALSALLSECANEIAERFDETEQPPFGDTNRRTLKPLLPFVREMVARIPQQDSLQAVLDQMGSSSTMISGTTDFDSAKRLSNFAVALLRAFPSRAQDIRVALYRGSVKTINDADVSTIQYFWNTARSTGVFKKITRDHRNVLSLLKEADLLRNQISQAPVTKAEIAQWQDEWRITLLFLELYTFVLKIMDDEDFFSHDKKTHAFGVSIPSPISLASRRGSLPLEDVAVMTTFLKNLAFVLYWNAAELVESNENEEELGIAALFGNTSQSSHKHTEKKQQTLTGNGVSQGYLKGLVTGVLRMLHERDSRRSFVPPGHWLMTTQVNMAGFIPAVVAEEERRHELGDDDDADDQLDDVSKDLDMDDAEDPLPEEQLLSSMFGIRPSHIPRSRASRLSDRIEKQRLQARKKRQLESLAPRLEILRNLPFFIPFETRVQIFREFIYRDQLRRRDGVIDPDTWRMSVATSTQGRGPDGRPRGLDIISRHHAEIRRESVFEDAFEAFHGLGEGLKEPIQITFIDKFGSPEAGIDGGGVTKEFLMSVTSEAFDPNTSLSMFKENSQRFLYPNPMLYQETSELYKRAGRRPGTEHYNAAMNDLLQRFRFLGRVVGKCLYEGILVDVSFAGFFLLKWALTGGTTVASNESGYRATINDLREFDEELYQGLLKLKNYPGDVENDFGLDFTVTDTITIEDDHGNETHQTITKELRPNGAKTAVTNANRPAYIDRIVRYRLQQQPKAVTDAFLQGLGQIVQPMWLAMFNQRELQKLVGGDNTELDIADLRRNTQYGGIYVIGDDGLEHPTVQLFWKALQDMSDADRRKVLKFVTSTPRAPLLGFSHLNPKFSIRDSSEDQERLPSTSTCVNLLKLPRYGDIRTMREKLLYAVNSGAGFDLS
ncbi:ubiquitin-protein ligase (E3) [Cladophialophora chaetospira]|uniref:HECT-type E3 ubiquitin transferase n=1 Tax=Cladophialophora chaetospira TaxID=386627 RepID=A0AA38X218_9EURO|nr:ubiquitin-protein ligase (E3) [Cladophialophora chaetospira]